MRRTDFILGVLILTLNAPGLLAPASARADTALTVTGSSPYGCLQNAELYMYPETDSGSFTLPEVQGTGTVSSAVPGNAPSFGYGPSANIYSYAIDISHLSSAPNHCVKLLIHFGGPDGCGSDEVFGSPSQIQSATLAPFGDITFVFGSSCLAPGQPAVGFTMFSEATPKYGNVTVIDDYVDPATGSNIEARINVSAIVPDIAPDPPPWVFLSSFRIPYAWFQGDLNIVGTNQYNTNGPPINGAYDFTLQVLHGPTNGLATSQVVTQTVQVVNGLFSLPLPFDPSAMADGSPHWLNLGVRQSGLPAVQFTPVGPPISIAPSPQAYYAYTAGSVADLAPGQAVKSLNGLTDAVILQPGNGILLGTNGNTLTISAQPGVVSDRDLKADFTKVAPADILRKLSALSITAWRYTNEVSDVRHLGPMAQDFKAAFGLGQDDKFIGFVDEEGVALTAIQGLNQKVESENAALRAENADLKARVEKLEGLVNSKNDSVK
jgi:hypothetical protein